MRSVLSLRHASPTICLGEAFDQSDRLLRGDELASFFDKCTTLGDFAERCDRLNGSWAVVLSAVCAGSIVYYLGVDHRATRSLYYRIVGDELWISENGFDLVADEDEAIKPTDDDALYFSRWGFTPLDRTLHPQIWRMPSGYALRICLGQSPQRQRYTGAWRTMPEASALSYPEALERMHALMRQAMDRMVRVIGDREIVLPLTGGRDSRLIALSLVERGLASRTRACTYGRHAETAEVREAREIARRLGLRHEFVCTIPEGYTDEGYTRDARVLHYLGYISGLGSGYFFGEYTSSLHYARQIDADSIALPGHAGDILGGTHLQHQPREGRAYRGRNAKSLVYFEGANRHLSAEDERRLREILDEQFATYADDWSEAQRFETFRTLELSSKYYINSARSWRYWGHSVWMPYLDRDLIDFVYSLPPAYRYGKRIYEDLTDALFAQYGISLPTDRSEWRLSQSPTFRLKQCLRPYLGRYLSERRKPFDRADDMGFARLMSGALMHEVQAHSPIRPNTINGISFAWWLYALEVHREVLCSPLGYPERGV